MILADLFIGFLKVGCFAFGGAYGAIPLIRDVVLHYGWLDDEMLAYMIAVSESTPGPIMVNMATYVGRTQAGAAGAAVATVAVVIPSFLIILLVLGILKRIWNHPYMQAVLRGLKPCMTGIILATGVNMTARNAFVLTNGAPEVCPAVMTVLLAAVYYGSRRIRKGGISPILLIVISAAAGTVIYGIQI
ncbi:chromate transporter [[Clostridium] aminophilum]|uniref:Chromate transporter n=1 Tax=[Clostridium] aminophilum TaxID=1526 RepID=A0A1I6JB63_9FIRM|nr:chromate transporter [[Clostridium] aminophilum]SFR76169.1 chromate transporter [[Clostridium] aminophilum]